MQCPKCSSLMSGVTAAYGEEAARCGNCGGIFCRKRTLELLQRQWMLWPRSDTRLLDTGDPSVGRRHDAIRNVDCPSCGSTMARSAIPDQPHIVVDRCPACGGVFFDAGELTDLRNLTFADWIRDLVKGRRD